jgi:hypothetical protein
MSGHLGLAVYTMYKYSSNWIAWGEQPSWAGNVYNVLCHLGRMEWAAILGWQCTQNTLSPGSHEVRDCLGLAVYNLNSVTWIEWDERPSWAGTVHNVLCHLDHMRSQAFLSWQCTQSTLPPGCLQCHLDRMRWAAILGCLSLVKIPFLFPATRRFSCFVMKSEIRTAVDWLIEPPSKDVAFFVYMLQ